MDPMKDLNDFYEELKEIGMKFSCCSSDKQRQMIVQKHQEKRKLMKRKEKLEKIHASWSLELKDDVKAYTGITIPHVHKNGFGSRGQTLVSVMAQEIKAEIDRHLIEEMVKAAKNSK
jgi:hypothetical protein